MPQSDPSAAAASAASAASATLIDDRADPTPAAWRFFTDGVMGGVSSGRMTAETAAGRPALCLRGEVRLDNNGGFIQMALELPSPPSGPWRGIELDVLGNGHRYGLHLRTADMTLPWQAWRATFVAPPVWHTVQLPFAAFMPHRHRGTLEAAAVRRIGILALGQAMTAEVCVARLAWLR
ncbi:MAG TPA: CIA30 family protein [Rubrivivax sp.]|nr:CIA30 family protein [Rubrivivax sp.]